MRQKLNKSWEAAVNNYKDDSQYFAPYLLTIPNSWEQTSDFPKSLNTSFVYVQRYMYAAENLFLDLIPNSNDQMFFPWVKQISDALKTILNEVNLYMETLRVENNGLSTEEIYNKCFTTSIGHFARTRDFIIVFETYRGAEFFENVFLNFK